MGGEINADDLAGDIIEVIPAVMRTIRMEMRKRRRSDLSVIQFRALLYLNLNPGASLSSLADHLGLTLPTVSQMINGLVEKGVIVRKDSSSDRRRVMLSLTEQGQQLLDISLRGTRNRLVEILSQMQAQDIETAHRVMVMMEGLFCRTQEMARLKRMK